MKRCALPCASMQTDSSFANERRFMPDFEALLL